MCVLFMLDDILDSDQSALWIALIGHTVQLKDLVVTVSTVCIHYTVDFIGDADGYCVSHEI